MNQVVARKDGQWMIVSMTPDVCLTPMGTAMVPVPYPVVAMLSQATDTSTSVKANGNPLFLFGSSSVPQTMGDQAGTGNGVMSGTVGKDCWALDKSGSVFCEGMSIVRANDKCWMNANAPCSPLTQAQVAMLERRSRIEAGKQSADPDVRANADQAEREQNMAERSQMLQCLNDPAAEPPAGWNQTAPGLFEPDRKLFDAAGLPAPPPVVASVDGTVSAEQLQFIKDCQNNGNPIASVRLTSRESDFEVSSASFDPASNRTDCYQFISERVFPLQEIKPRNAIKMTGFDPRVNDGTRPITLSGPEPVKYDDREELDLFIKARDAACAALMPSLPPVPKVTLPSTGNTQGMVVYAPLPASPAGDVNPVVKPETPEESIRFMDWVHTGLDVAGLCDFFPPLSIIADGVNALAYVVEGIVAECNGEGSSEYWANAALSGAAMIPGVGIAATAGKAGKTAKKLHKGFTTAQKATTVAGVGMGGYSGYSGAMEAIDGFKSGDMEKGWHGIVDGAIGATSMGLSAKDGYNAAKQLVSGSKAKASPPLAASDGGGQPPPSAGGGGHGKDGGGHGGDGGHGGGGDGGGGKPPSDTGDGGKVGKKTPPVPQDAVDAYTAELEKLSKSEVKKLSADAIEDVPSDKVKEKRKEFDTQKKKLIQDWEEKNGKPWPKYEEDVYSNHGKLIRSKGDNFDAHHIHPLGWGGANSADNLIPMHALDHYDKAGVHAPNSQYGTISDLLKLKK